jgi:hypothetical protein
MATEEAKAIKVSNSHLRIVVSEGKVTMDDLHKALERSIQEIVRGGCNCGLTGFDVSFVRGDPTLTALTQIPNIRGSFLTHG